MTDVIQVHNPQHIACPAASCGVSLPLQDRLTRLIDDGLEHLADVPLANDPA